MGNMKSKYVTNPAFTNYLLNYISEQKFLEVDIELLAKLIENEDMRFLMSLWMSSGNRTQLQYIFVDLTYRLQGFNDGDEPSALNRIFEAAHSFRQMLPKISDDSLVINSLSSSDLTKPSNEEDALKGWLSLNRPIFDIKDQDLGKLAKYAHLINAGIFTANTVLDMNPQECATFDDRIGEIINTHADYILPSQHNSKELKPFIYPDKLAQLLKSDQIISEILSGVTPMVPRETVDALLGFDDSDTESEQHDSPRPLETLDSVAVTGGFWRRFNIDNSLDISDLIDRKIITTEDVPDECLTQKQEAYYKQLNQSTQNQQHPSFDAHDSDTDHTTDESVSQISSRSDSPMVSTDKQKGAIPSTATEVVLPAKTRKQKDMDRRYNPVPEQAKERGGVRVVKDSTHNTKLKEINKN